MMSSQDDEPKLVEEPSQHRHELQQLEQEQNLLPDVSQHTLPGI